MTTTDPMTVANEIARQIGYRAFQMMGTRTKLGDVSSLLFDIRGSKRWNKVRVTLDQWDTYTIEFFKIGGKLAEVKNQKSVEMVYAEDLHRIIEKETGLFLNL